MNKKIRKRILHISVFIIALLLILGIVIVGLNSDLLSREKTEISENVDIIFNSSGTYNWTPKEKGKILSIKIFGEIEGNGIGNIFIEGIQIFGEIKNKDNLISGKFIEFVNIQSENNTNETIIDNSTSNNETINETIIDDSTNSTNVENITNSTSTNETIIDNSTNSTNVENVSTDNQENEDEEDVEKEEDKKETKTENIIKKIETETLIQNPPPIIFNQKTEEKIDMNLSIITIESPCKGLCKLKKMPKKDFYELKIQISDGSIIKIKKIIYEMILE